MRYIQLFIEDQPINNLVNSLDQQSKLKAEQAKKLKQQSQMAKKRQSVNDARSNLLKKQTELTAAASKPN